MHGLLNRERQSSDGRAYRAAVEGRGGLQVHVHPRFEEGSHISRRRPVVPDVNGLGHRPSLSISGQNFSARDQIQNSFSSLR